MKGIKTMVYPVLGVLLCNLCLTLARSLSKVMVPLNAKPGHIITQLPHINGQSYQLRDPLGGSISDLFTVMSQGQLITRADLTSLEGQSVFMYVEHQHPSNSWSQILHMDVLDDPEILQFEGQPYKGHIMENEPAGTIVQGLEMFQNSVKKFPYSSNLTLVSGDMEYFEIKSLPWSWNDIFLLNKKPLDREEKSCYHLVVKAEDIGSPEIFALITVYVDDDNDNKPEFKESVYSESISMDIDPLSTIMRLLAEDLDMDNVVSYLMDDNDIVYTLPDTGDVIVKDPTNLKEQSYEFDVFAVDQNGVKSAPASVRIEAVHPDSIGQDVASSRNRRAVDERVFVVNWDVTAGDLFSVADETSGPTSRYAIQDGASVPNLSIDPLTGSVFVVAGRQWNISQDEFTFTVNITKTDQPDFQQFLLVRIKMTDRGPFDPIFTNQPQPLTAMLLNWVRPYTLVAQLQAIDATEGAISQYKIESGAEGRFSIDPFTGDLITLGRLPFNCAEPFELAISAQTVGVPPSQSTPAQVLKVYCQELDPLFYQNPYDVTIDELMATDQVVLTVEAYSFFELPIKYKLTDESSPNSASEWFSIDENTGAIRPKMNLRYAFEPHQYRLVVTAQEQYSNKQSQVLAIINLRDINNYAPSFPLVMYMPEEPIPENAPIGTSVLEVSVIDLDSGEFGEVTFSINDPRFAVVPSLDKKSAQIQVAEPLDYDRLPGRMYEFMVTAEDGGGKIGESMIRVPISNINDETPVFTKADEQPIWIMQSATVGTVVHIIQVHDPDGDNIRLKFKGSSSLVNSKFRLNATSGELSITEALTEQEQMYYLPIVAEDDSSCCDGVGTRHYANVVIVIDFIGVNRAPYFTDCNSMAPAFMEEASGTAAGVAQIRATDPDPGSNGQMTFSIVVTRSKPTYFNIRPVPGEQGVAEIYPNITFNREKPEVNSYKIGSKYMYPVTVKVEDNGKRNLSATCFFLVHILDVNDHDPQFDTSQDYKTVIRDDTPVGARAVRVFAWDEDEGENARVTYSIQQGPICGGQACMSIDPTTGWISVATSIPNDMTTINLVVTATDNGSPARSQNVNVIITRTNDINLLPPRWNKVDGFEIDDYLGFVDSPIPENVAIGYKLPEKFSVTSLKPGNQSYWYYVVDNSLAPELNQEGIFQSSTVNINGNSMMEVVISNRLNFEETDHYILQLTASYLDDPTLFSEARLRVAIKDTNDQAPFFLGQTGNGVYPAYVTEGRQDSYPVHVTSVFAIDLDGTSPNNKVTYFFTDACINKGDCQYFDINADTGAITTMQEFTLCNGDDVCQGTTQKYFNLYIIAKDGDDSWLDSLRNSSSVQIVTITVNGASMNPPYFEESDYSVELPIGPYYNQTVAVVTAVSPDDGGELYPQYGITAGNNKRLFAVDSETGVIKAYGYPSQSQPEDSMEHTLRYRVFDGLKSKYTTVHVKFTDNAYPPVFDPVIYNVGQIQEEDPTISRNNPRLITSLVTATDPDKEGVSYSLSGSLYDPSLFFINEDGNTWMQQPLDRDFPGGYSNWQLNIVAEDLDGSNNQKFGYGILNLELIDINDNAPKFDSCCISGELGENENNVEVLTVKATDSDVGENARISYFLPPGGVPMKDGQPLFNIDSQGTIRNTLPLDREEIGEYTLVVSARDHGDPVRQTNQTVYITVTDKNDSPPEFAQNEYVVTIAENMAVGSSVLALTAADADSAENTLLTYVVEDGQDSQYFYMDSIYPAGVGVAKIDKVIDYDDNGIRELRFSILVSDGVRPARTNVVVTITDANDNAPIITPQNSPTISLVENADPGQTVFTFNASDIDSGTNKQFYWGIDYENTDQFMNFAINENGEVRVRRRIDYEETPSLRVHVLAIDKGYPAMTGTATLNIEVINVNDNGPTLNMPPPGEYPYVGPNTNIGSQVAKIPIVDADGNDAKPYQLQACQITIGCNDFSFKLDDDRENLIVTANMDKTYSREALGFSFYTIPVVLVDSGSPRMTGTSTLIIYVENAQSQAVKPTDKELKVYNYNWNLHDVAIGSVATDFDIAGNTYELMGEHYGFELRNGPTLYILSEASPGRSALKVEVCRSQVCSISNIYVNVIAIDDNAVKSSGSMRLQGITAEAFITKSGQDSAMITLQMTLSEILDTAPENIEIFSVSNVPGQQNTIDVLYAAHGSPWYTPSRLNGRAMASKDMISQNLKLTALQVPIDDCSTTNCYDGGCTNKLVVNNGPAVVNGNTNTMAGVNANIVAMCTCGATYQEDITPNPQRCVNGSCLNGGTCRETFGDIQCDCPSGFEGPQCQQLRHSFSGDGWAWYDSLEVCYEDRLSFEIATIQRSSLLLYQGPIGSDVPPGEMPDFISIELIDGYPNLRLNLGDGEVEPGLQVTGFNSRGQKTMNSLDDGKWHMIEVIKSGMNISIIVDMCKDAEIIETLEATSEDRDACEARGVIPGQRFVLRDVSPLQIGGRQNPGTNYPTVLRKEGFNGCIRNLRHNGKLYDLHIGQKGEHENSADGCQREDAICQAKPCLGNSTCSAGISGSQTMCSCLPGFRGTNCETDTTSKDVETENSFMEWELDDSFNDTHVLEATEIQVMFRTRQTHGMIFSALSFSGLEHLKLSIAESHIEFAYDLGADEDTVSLPFLNVSDGEWHVANIQRQGSQVILKVDGGNGRYYNESGPFLGKHSLFSIFKEFVYGASDLEYKLYHPNPYPRNTLQSSCLNDFRYDDSWLPMIEDENRDSDTADLVKDVDMSEGCGAGTPCLAGSVCVAPLVCVNGWRLPVCMCPVGMIPHPTQVCVIRLDCYNNDCSGHGQCVNTGNGGSYCICDEGWFGDFCNQEALVGAMIATWQIIIIILAILLILLIAAFLAIAYRNKNNKQPLLDIDPDDDVRENVVFYNEEGAGEEDMLSYDITRLQKPMDDGDSMMKERRELVPYQTNAEPMAEPPFPQVGPDGKYPNIGDFIDDRLTDADDDPNSPPYDSVREYQYEGSGSTAGSLSSLNSSSSDGSQDYEYLNEWGPRFAKLAELYGGGAEDDEDASSV